jgi:chemotaxis protein methyltransferase CheR
VIADRLTDDEFRRAGAQLGARCGLRFDEANRAILEKGLLRAAAAEGSVPSVLLDKLERTPSEALVQSVLRQVTIGETYFFRHPEHFAALRDVIVPDRMRAHGLFRELRAWSAGCATGEEAWSLVMSMSAGAGAGWKVSVLGTDINRAALETARRGEYGSWSVRSTLPLPAGMTRPLADGGAAVAPWLHSQVRFDYLNLHDPIYPSLYTATQGLDVIFCRNVLVYFNREAALQVLARMRDCLVDGGWLLVGALDVDFAPPGLERVNIGGITLLHKRTPVEVARPKRPTPPRPLAPLAPPVQTAQSVQTAENNRAAEASRRLLTAARAAADCGALAEAATLARRAVDEERSPLALHLLALLLGEQGEEEEQVRLLREVVAQAPDDALAHLALGVSERGGAPAARATHLRRVLALTAHRLEGERLQGPEPLPVSWVRKVASAALRRVEGGT